MDFEEWKNQEIERLKNANGNLKPWTQSEVYQNQYNMSASVNTVDLSSFELLTSAVWSRTYRSYNYYDMDVLKGNTIQFQCPIVDIHCAFTNDNEINGTLTILKDWVKVDMTNPTLQPLPIPLKNYGVSANLSLEGYPRVSYFPYIDPIINGVVVRNENSLHFARSTSTTAYSNYAIYYLNGTHDGITYLCVASMGYNDARTQGSFQLFGFDINNEHIENVTGGYTLTGMDIFDIQYGEPNAIGGYGGVGSAFSVVSDKIAMPSKPSLGVSSTGLLNVYKVNEFTLANFGSFLFSTEPTDDTYYVPTEEVEEMDDITNAMAKMVNGIASRITHGIKQSANGDLVDYVIDCHILPFSPQVEANASYIKVGWKTSEFLGKKVTDDYTDISCGNVEIPYMYNNFLDTQAKVQLFVPFVGFVSLSAQQVIGKTINLTYRFNVIDGSFIAYVREMIGSDYTIIGTYSGSACVHMPITGVNYSNIVGGMMQTASGLIGGIGGAMTGNPLALVGGFASAVQGLNSMNNSGQVQQSNGYNASASFMGQRKPFVIIEYPQQALPSNYYHTYGAPLMAKKKLNELKGYTVCANVDTSGLQIDSRERDEIKRLLESGVYL